MKSRAWVRLSLVVVALSMLALPAQSLAGQIVFQHGSQTSGSSLYVMNDDGSDQRALITNQGGIANPGQPNLFPDSTNLAFSASAPGLAGYSGAEACGYNCFGIYSVIGGTLRRVSPPVVSCAADTSDCATQIDESPSLTEDGRVVYAHVGSIVEPLCTYYDCGVYGGLGTEFLVQSDVGGDTPAEWQTANDAGQFQPTYPLGSPSADPGDASLVAYSGLEDFNCSDVGACGPLTVDESNGTGAYNVTDASCSGSCGNEGGLTVLGWSPGGKYILVDYGTNSTAPGVWIFENQAYSKTNQGSGPFYGTGWWVWEPTEGNTIGQGGAITSDTVGDGKIIFTQNGNITSIPGSCWSGTPTFTNGQPLPQTISPAANCNGKYLTTDGQDNFPTWTSSASTIGISSNNGPPPGKATSTLGRVGVSGTTVSVSLKCSAGSGDCADTLGLGTDETLRGSKVTVVAASKTKHKVVIVGAGRVTLGAGSSKTVKVSLDAAGRKLLKKFHKLPVLVIAVQGSRTFGSHKVTFKYHH
jgi:hypothetical protein